MSEQVEAIKREAADAKETVADARRRVSAAIEQRRDGPAADVDDAQAKLASLRNAIERDVATLRARAPEPDELKAKVRTVGMAVGGGVAAIGLGGTLLGRRKRRSAHEAEVRLQAVGLAQEVARELARLERQPEGSDTHDRERAVGPLRVLLVLAAIGVGVAAWLRRREEQPPTPSQPAV